MTDQQVLEVIEMICGDDFCEDLSMREAQDDLNGDADLQFAQRKLATIYRFAHSYVKSHACFEAHDSWRKEGAEAHAALLGKQDD